MLGRRASPAQATRSPRSRPSPAPPSLPELLRLLAASSATADDAAVSMISGAVRCALTHALLGANKNPRCGGATWQWRTQRAEMPLHTLNRDASGEEPLQVKVGGVTRRGVGHCPICQRRVHDRFLFTLKSSVLPYGHVKKASLLRNFMAGKCPRKRVLEIFYFTDALFFLGGPCQLRSYASAAALGCSACLP